MCVISGVDDVIVTWGSMSSHLLSFHLILRSSHLACHQRHIKVKKIEMKMMNSLESLRLGSAQDPETRAPSNYNRLNIPAIITFYRSLLPHPF